MQRILFGAAVSNDEEDLVAHQDFYEIGHAPVGKHHINTEDGYRPFLASSEDAKHNPKELHTFPKDFDPLTKSTKKSKPKSPESLEPTK